jgi:uncharacterized protein YndB with AHSA1/START domain
MIEAPIEKVWDEITKTGRLQKALYNTVLETDLVPGSRLRYYSVDKKRVFVVGEVVEVQAPTKFVHTYVNCLKPDPETLVTWELESADGGCRVNMTHTGWTTAHHKPEKHEAGWKEILGLLKSEVETGTIPFKWRVIYRIMGWTMFLLPASTKAGGAEARGW